MPLPFPIHPIKDKHMDCNSDGCVRLIDAQALQDAARYRWLRAFNTHSILEDVLGIEPGRHPQHELDCVIDAEIKRETP